MKLNPAELVIVVGSALTSLVSLAYALAAWRAACGFDVPKGSEKLASFKCPNCDARLVLPAAELEKIAAHTVDAMARGRLTTRQ